MKLRVVFCFVFISLTTESCKVNNDGNEHEKKIVIVNFGNSARGEIARLIDDISNCYPRVIGLDVFLTARDSSRIDSLLINSIRNSGKVVLLDDLLNRNRLQSNLKAVAYRIAYATQYFEGNELYCPLEIADGKELYESMGFVLAQEYDSELIVNFVLSKGNTTKAIRASEVYNEKYIVVGVDALNSNCNQFKDMIVILGDVENTLESNGDEIVLPYLTASTVSFAIGFKGNE